MERKIEDVEKSMKRSNDKQLKIELECCQKVWLQALSIIWFIQLFYDNMAISCFIMLCNLLFA